MILLIGLRRSDVGADTENYINTYYRVTDNSYTNSDVEWLGNGFVLLDKIIGVFFGQNYIAYNTIIAILTILPIYYVFWKSSKKPTLSIYIFFCLCLLFQTMNQSRQMLAVSLVLLALYFLYTKSKKITSILLILLAASIHKSALIALIFIPTNKIRINKKVVAIFLGLALLALLVDVNSIQNVIGLTSYSTYIDSDYSTSRATTIIKLIYEAVVLLSAIILNKRKKDQYVQNLILINMAGFILRIFSTKIYIMERLCYYSLITHTLLIPNLLENIDTNKKKVFNITIILLYLLYFGIYFYSVAKKAQYLPYNYAWSI